MITRLFRIAALASFLASPAAAQPAGKAGPSGEYAPWGFDLSGADPATRPGDDFFRYANGRWLDRTVIAPDRPANSIDRVLSDVSESRMRAILERGPEGVEASAAADAAKAAAIYASFMASDRVEALGLQPIADALDRLRARPSREEIVGLMGGAYATFHPTLFNLAVVVDAKKPESYAVQVNQSGLGLPDRDYYLLDAFSEKRAAYLAYAGELLSLIGWDDPSGSARAILELETAIAAASWSLTEQRDSDRAYNPMSVPELEAAAPFPWKSFLSAAGLDQVERLVVSENTAVPKLAKLFAEASPATLAAWQAFGVVDHAAPYLSARFVQAHFAFRSGTLEGVAALPERWKRGVKLANELMGEGIGRVYVARHFPPETKAQVDAMVDHLRAAMRSRIERVSWMEPSTKAAAIEKLARIRMKLGYPDTWRSHEALDVRPGDLVGNVRRGGAFNWLRRTARLTQPVDRDEWDMTPQTVNAYYDPTLNEIVLPAGEMQPPYFDAAADPAANYGGIGAFIGHELTHALDDDGRKYDGAGVLRDWWTEADIREFGKRAAELGRQYDRFEIVPGGFVNGGLTMGENIADLGGALIALDAYRASLGGRPAPVIGGLTGEQRFFLAYAQQWRVKRTDEYVRRMLVTDPHAPEVARVNGPLRNIDAWYEAFGVGPGDALYLAPDKRVRLW